MANYDNQVDGDLLVTGNVRVLGRINDAKVRDITSSSQTAQMKTEVLDTSVTGILSDFSDLESDGKLTPSEKLVVKREWTNTESEYAQVLNQASRGGFEAGDTAYDNYVNAYNALDTYLNGDPDGVIFSLTTTTDITGSTLRSTFATYYEQRETLLDGLQQQVATDIATAAADASQAIADAATAQGTADGKVTTFYQDTEPTAEGVGDLWVDTSDDNKLFRWSGAAWVEVRDAGIAEAIADAATAQTTADGKIVSFYQDTEPTAEGVGDLWMDTGDNNKVYRWNGSAWVDADRLQNGVVTEDILADGSVTEGKIGTNAVTNAKLALNAVDSDELVDSAVIEAKLADAAVAVAKLQDNAVTSAKLGPDCLASVEENLVAHWAMDQVYEDGGSYYVEDSSGNGHTATATSVVGQSVVSDSGAGSPGISGGDLVSGYGEYSVTLPDTFTLRVKFKPNFAYDTGSSQWLASFSVSATKRFIIYYYVAIGKIVAYWQDGGTGRYLASAQYDDGTSYRNINQWIELVAAIDLTTGTTAGSALYLNGTQDDTAWSGNIDAKTTEFPLMQIRAYNGTAGDYDIAYCELIPDYVATAADVAANFTTVNEPKIRWDYTDDANGVDSGNEVSGKSGKAVDFDGSADYLTVSDDATLQFGIEDFAILLWVKFDSAAAAAAEYLVDKRNSSSYEGITVYRYTDEKIYFTTPNVIGTSWHAVSSDSTITDTASFHHIVLQRTSGVMEMWIDGVKQTDTQAATTSVSDDTYNIRIGASVVAGNKLDGKIDEIRFYSTALTEAQIKFLYMIPSGTYGTMIDGVRLKNGVVQARHIEALAVTTEKLDAGAVTSEKITAGAVETTQLAADAVTANEIAANAVGAEQIAAESVEANHLAISGGDAIAGKGDAISDTDELFISDFSAISTKGRYPEESVYSLVPAKLFDHLRTEYDNAFAKGWESDSWYTDVLGFWSAGENKISSPCDLTDTSVWDTSNITPTLQDEYFDGMQWTKLNVDSTSSSFVWTVSGSSTLDLDSEYACLTITLKKGVGSVTYVQLYDYDASANRIALTVTWATSTVNVSTGTEYDAIWHDSEIVEIRAKSATACVSGNNNRLIIYPDTSETVNDYVYVTGVSLTSAKWPTPYIPTVRPAASLWYRYDWATTGVYIEGFIRPRFDFDTSSNQWIVSDYDSGAPSGNAYNIGVWYDASSDQIKFRIIGASNTVTVTAGCNDSGTWSSSNTFVSNTYLHDWIHFAFFFSPTSTINCWINGGLIDADATDPGTLTFNPSLSIGSLPRYSSPAGYEFNGEIADLRIGSSANHYSEDKPWVDDAAMGNEAHSFSLDRYSMRANQIEISQVDRKGRFTRIGSAGLEQRDRSGQLIHDTPDFPIGSYQYAGHLYFIEETTPTGSVTVSDSGTDTYDISLTGSAGNIDITDYIPSGVENVSAVLATVELAVNWDGTSVNRKANFTKDGDGFSTAQVGCTYSNNSGVTGTVGEAFVIATRDASRVYATYSHTEAVKLPTGILPVFESSGSYYVRLQPYGENFHNMTSTNESWAVSASITIIGVFA